MKLLFIGDIVGGESRKTIKKLLPSLKTEFKYEFCVGNAENIAGGAGITAKVLEELSPDLVNVFTSGDHVWDQKEFVNEIEDIKNFLRPANFKSSQPGRGWAIFVTQSNIKIAVINLIGRVFMKDTFANCPFEIADKILEEIADETKIILVDFHAEATSEKAALAHYLDGRVSAVIGSHTHVQTNDAKILPNGTAFISDAGMVGPENSILGRETNSVVKKFVSGMPTRLDMAKGPIRFNGVLLEVDPKTGKSLHIQTINLLVLNSE